MKPIEIKHFIINTIKEHLVNNYNFELIENISVNLKRVHKVAPIETFIKIKLCDCICFAPRFEESERRYWTCSISINDTQQHIVDALKNIIFKIQSDLYEVNVFHYPLWHHFEDVKHLNIEQLNDMIFPILKKDYSNLNKSQQSIMFGLLGKKLISSGDELLTHIENFMFINKRFPFKYEELYKMYEYAIDIKILTKEHLIKIEELRNNRRKEHSQACLQQLKNFCIDKKRWFYNTEKEMVDCIKHIYRYYRYNWFDEQECQEIDDLFKMYANNESKGELAVNSYLVKLGYTIKKQFTFDDCKDKRKLPFDTMFYIDKKMCLIEFDGEQHYDAIDYFGGEEHLKYIQHHDKIKNEYCKMHHIPLLRIKYDEINDINKLIDQFIDSIKTMVT